MITFDEIRYAIRKIKESDNIDDQMYYIVEALEGIATEIELIKKELDL